MRIKNGQFDNKTNPEQLLLPVLNLPSGIEPFVVKSQESDQLPGVVIPQGMNRLKSAQWAGSRASQLWFTNVPTV